MKEATLNPKATLYQRSALTSPQYMLRAQSKTANPKNKQARRSPMQNVQNIRKTEFINFGATFHPIRDCLSILHWILRRVRLAVWWGF